MSTSVSKIVTRIRETVGDETRMVWDDTADILEVINRGRIIMWAKRPEAFWTSKVLDEIPDNLTSATSGNIDVTDRYAEALIAYCSYVLFMQQRREGDREKASEQLDIYTRLMAGG